MIRLYRARHLPFCALALVVALSSCGGGEEGTGVTAGAPKSVVSGTITAFGSIWVNGIEFNIDSSAVTIDGTTAANSDLRVGMVVTVSGTINADKVSGTANSVSVVEVIRGPVTSVGASSIVVLGQTINAGNSTVFENFTNLADLAGSAVEVSGYVAAPGNIAATRIEKLDSSPEDLELQGIVSALNQSNKQFMLGALIVNYAGATDLPALADGQLIIVKGTYSIAAQELLANEIDLRTVEVTDAEDFAYEGAITASLDEVSRHFTLDNLQVQISDATVFNNIATGDLTVGVRVNAEGYLQDGVVHASEISRATSGE